MSELTVTTADAEISEYNSGQGVRCFCSVCGSPVWFKSIDFPDMFMTPLGALDSVDFDAPHMHLFTGSKAEWHSIADDLPQHETIPQEN